MQGRCTATGAALAAGMISEAHAQVIVGALEALPPVDAGTRARAEEFLIGQAGLLDPVLLGRVARELREKLTATPDADDRALRQDAACDMSRTVAPDGMARYVIWADPAADALICAALDPLAAPRPTGPDGTPDPRTPSRRRFDALLELIRIALAAGTLPEAGGAKPTLNITIDYDVLTGRLAGAGLLDTGEPISAAAARRHACDAGIFPVVLGGASQPLDVGRTTRTPPAVDPPSPRRPRQRLRLLRLRRQTSLV